MMVSSTGGSPIWQCFTCKQWIPNGQLHAHNTSEVESPVPVTYYFYGNYKETEIADALESIEYELRKINDRAYKEDTT